jgi:hypothetical protein
MNIFNKMISLLMVGAFGVVGSIFSMYTDLQFELELDGAQVVQPVIQPVVKENSLPNTVVQVGTPDEMQFHLFFTDKSPVKSVSPKKSPLVYLSPSTKGLNKKFLIPYLTFKEIEKQEEKPLFLNQQKSREDSLRCMLDILKHEKLITEQEHAILIKDTCLLKLDVKLQKEKLDIYMLPKFWETVSLRNFGYETRLLSPITKDKMGQFGQQKTMIVDILKIYAQQLQEVSESTSGDFLFNDVFGVDEPLKFTDYDLGKRSFDRIVEFLIKDGNSALLGRSKLYFLDEKNKVNCFEFLMDHTISVDCFNLSVICLEKHKNSKELSPFEKAALGKNLEKCVTILNEFVAKNSKMYLYLDELNMVLDILACLHNKHVLEYETVQALFDVKTSKLFLDHLIDTYKFQLFKSFYSDNLRNDKYLLSTAERDMLFTKQEKICVCVQEFVAQQNK